MREKNKNNPEVPNAPASDLLVSVTRIKEAQVREATASDGGTSGRSDTNDKAIEW